MAHPVQFAAVEKFSPANGERWEKYIAWSGLTQLREVISLDSLLCPGIIQQLTAGADLDSLLARIGARDGVNVLALLQEPTQAAIDSFRDTRFTFRGFDLIERDGSISALTNCGGFELAFANSDLSEFGLLTDLATAQRTQHLLRERYPTEPHANCDVWALWLMNLQLDRAG